MISMSNLMLSRFTTLKMADRIFALTFFIISGLIICYAILSISHNFTDKNPIRVASDGLHHFQSSALPSKSPSSTIEAIYQFGDSISDTGNYIRENPNSRFAKLPYGQTFFHKPTGRCSNGLLMIDYFICKQKLAKALIMMGEIGGNDYNRAFSQGKPIIEIYKTVPEVVQIIKYAIKEVINLGATRIVVPGNFPIGCMTIYLKMFKTDSSRLYDELQCLKSLNKFAKFHNSKLQEVIGELQSEYQDVSIVYADYFLAMKEILKHATSLGFDKDTMETPCCGTNEDDKPNKDSHIVCGRKGVVVCEDSNKHVNWDSVHLTQHAYHIMAKLLIKRINIWD
ncbi:GDSL esterase/lipase At1g28570 isoform X2 [Beta vulgaris subsp. vulgaris]|uniref:GDSL esterase/lipase At1g28570 isoform X2 n=1 Tax=Beta vulgaris subsp. vulgaris TaxID=3555 RepID=UPI002547B66C|nr:GDSL esterase/lipase At1g28570 isoform X2 [Beta vulgaris subsp. vulgaris]